MSSSSSSSSSLKRNASKAGIGKHAKPLVSGKLTFKPADIHSDPEDPILDDYADEPPAKKAALELKSLECKEEMPTEQQLVPLIQQAREQAMAVKSTMLIEEVPFDNNDDEPVDIVAKIKSEAARLGPKVRTGTVRVKNPDLAMYLWSMHSKSNIYWMEFLDAGQKIKATRSKISELKPTSFCNVSCKRMKQRFHESLKAPLMNFTMLSPACRLLWFNYGITKEEGVEGNFEKLIDGGIVGDKDAKYTFDLSNESYSELVVNGDLVNPVADAAFEHALYLEKLILGKFFDVEGAMTDIESKWKIQAKSTGIPVPSTTAEKVERAFADKLVNTKIKIADKDDPDDVGRKMAFNCSVHRTLYKDQRTKEPEDISSYVPPSKLFAECTMNRERKRTIHNDIPFFVCRRAEDVVEGVDYDDTPFFPIPKENVSVDWKNDIVFVLHSKGFYEWKMGGSGVPNKILAMVWLNTRSALDLMRAKEIVACDPRKAIPMAGVYEGPMDKVKKAAAKTTAVVTENAVDFMSNA